MADLLSLLKTFDVSFAFDDDFRQIQGLNPSRHQDVVVAVRRLVLPEFRSYPAATQQRLLTLLRTSLATEDEDFSGVFGRLEMIFDTVVPNKKAFMSGVLAGLESES